MAPTTLKEKAQQALKTNPSALGDPVSLKAETSGSTHDLDGEQKKQRAEESRGTQEGGEERVKEGKGEGKTLKEAAEENPTLLGDPVSLKAESSERAPTKEEEGARKGKDSKL